MSPVDIAEFKPPLWMRPSIVQTALASFKFRKKGPNSMAENAQDMVLDCGPARLLGKYSKHPHETALAILLHGWEGSDESTYVYCAGRELYDQGVSIFRLNLRDHGASHHLNEGLFNSTLFEEVYQGVYQAAQLAGNNKAYLTGFSLGGNYALRVARALEKKPIKPLEHVVAISPVIDPWAAAPLVDANRLFQRYFRKKWKASMAKKAEAFPGLYDFTPIQDEKTVFGMTDYFLSEFTDFPDKASYFNAYKIEEADLQACPVPISIISAKDDAMIPVEHIERLKMNDQGRKILLDYGGHNGFFQSLTGPTWYDDYLKKVIFPS